MCGDVVDPEEAGAFTPAVRGDRESGPEAVFPAIGAGEAREKRLSGHADQERPTEVRQPPRPGEELAVVFKGFPKADSGVEHDAVLINAA